MSRQDHEDLKSREYDPSTGILKDDNPETFAERLKKAQSPRKGDSEYKEQPEARLLGKIISIPIEYDPGILVAIPRSQNRDKHGMGSPSFDGNDYWRCYECSTLTLYGMPVYFMMTIQYDSNSPCIVESKSLKLYLNSFNMTKQEFSEPSKCITAMCDLVKFDLEAILGVKPEVSSYDYAGNDYSQYKDLQSIVDYSWIASEGYNVERDILKISYIREHKTVQWKFEGFRSNCRITNQPDYATVFISAHQCYNGIDPVSLVKYLTSFRNENHFHEECCELIFTHLNDTYNPCNLYVTCSYTRRGGIDISPTRFTKKPADTKLDYLTKGVSGTPDFKYTITPARTQYQ
jgi:7-cyano-7-deazaguanine reductase